MPSPTPLFPAFTTFNLSLSPSLSIHGIRGGTGPALLLIHGFPQTHHIWHRVAPKLAEKYTVVAIDLRGYGQSSKLPSNAEENHKPYAKSSMAKDCVEVMEKLGFEGSFNVLAHDRGARVAHKLAVDYPDKIEKLMLLDIAPTLAMFNKTDRIFAAVYWHWFFLIQPSPFPERLIMASPKEFQNKFFNNAFSGSSDFIDPLAMAEYGAQLTDYPGVHAMCEDYRAAATIDLEEAKDDIEKNRKMKCALRVLWGKKGIVESKFDALQEWRDVCDGDVSGEAVDSGHYIPEENPEVVLKHALEFFA